MDEVTNRISYDPMAAPVSSNIFLGSIEKKWLKLLFSGRFFYFLI